MIRESMKRSKAGGFTLIEILVVVAIIALLVAILLPSLRNAREQGRALVCAAHLDEVFKGLLMYTHENYERLPHLGFRDEDEWPFWPAQIARAVGYQYKIYTCPSDKEPSQVYVKFLPPPLRIQMCGPNATGAAAMDISYSGACDALEEGQNWGTTDGSLYPDDPNGRALPRKITDFKRPATSIAMIEGRDLGATDKWVCMRYANILEYADRTQPDMFEPSWARHLNRSNFLFFDGHVSRHTPEQAVNTLAFQQEFDPPERPE